MKRYRSLLRTGIRSDIARLQLGPVNQTYNPDSVQRISSLRPHIVVFLAVLASAVALSSALRQAISSGHMPWAMLALGAAHGVVALAGFMAWKRVRRGARHYVVSDLFKSEAISFDDVFRVTEARGFLWKTVRIHLRRPSRFGWDVSFVPARSAGMSSPLVSAWRTRRLAEERLIPAG
jgi:hypothetical protein